MLSMSRGQMEALERTQFDRMIGRIQGAIATTLPDTCAAPADVDAAEDARRRINAFGAEIIERGIELGVKLDLQSDQDLAAFIALGLSIKALPQTPPAWVGAWLHQASISGSARLEVIESELARCGADDKALLTILQHMQSARRLVKA